PLIALLEGARSQLGRAARRLIERIERSADRVAVPTVCLFEVALLEERGRVQLGLPFERWCDLVEESPGLLLSPLDRTHASEARALPTLKDPFDRLIAGTAVALGIPLISPDSRIASAGRVKVIW